MLQLQLPSGYDGRRYGGVSPIPPWGLRDTASTAAHTRQRASGRSTPQIHTKLIKRAVGFATGSPGCCRCSSSPCPPVLGQAATQVPGWQSLNPRVSCRGRLQILCPVPAQGSRSLSAQGSRPLSAQGSRLLQAQGSLPVRTQGS